MKTKNIDDIIKIIRETIAKKKNIDIKNKSILCHMSLSVCDKKIYHIELFFERFGRVSREKIEMFSIHNYNSFMLIDDIIKKMESFEDVRHTVIESLKESTRYYFHHYKEDNPELYYFNTKSYTNVTKGEAAVMKFLKNNKIEFKAQKKFNGCVDKDKLRFDFYITDKNVCIEYDGRQHYEIVEHFGGVKGFNDIQRRDEIKNKFCKENNIKLIRIPYTEYGNIETILEKELGCS